MNYRDKTKSELIKELLNLQKKHNSIKASFENDFIEDRNSINEIQYLNQILQNIKEGIQLTRTSDATIVYTNPRFDSMFGYQKGDLNGKHVSILNASGDKKPDDIASEILKCLLESGSWTGNILNIRKDGSTFWSHASISTFSHPEYGTIWISEHEDITERMKIEESLRNSEERWRNLVTASPDFIALHDLEGNYLFLNRYAKGYSEKDIIGKSSRNLIADGSKELFRKTFNKCLKSKRMQKFEYNAFGENMKLFTYEGHFVPIIEYGKVVSIMSIAKDITGQKQVEEALRQEKENFRNSLDDSPLGVRIATVDGNTIYANKTILDFYGYNSLWELQNTPLKDRYTPESYAEAQKRKYQREHSDFSAIDYEISIVRKNGEIRHLRVFRKEVLWNDLRVFQAIYNDITELKHDEEALRESEARFRSIFENSFVGISIARPGSGLLLVNQAYAHMYGYENPEILLSEVRDTNMLFANPEERKEVLRELQRNGFMEPKEFELIRRDGSHFFVMVSAGEIRDSEGKLHYYQATHIDLTDRKKMEENLLNAKELLEKLNIHQTEIREEERAKISREIHDQLGQSMTALKLDLNRMHKYISSIPEAVTKLESMIELVSDTIKDVQRISSDLRPGILDELGLVSAIEWYCDEFEQRTGIKCILKLEDSNYKDPQINLAFFRILQETLTNVIRHAKASRVSIKLNQSKKGATMTVQDNGIGIPVEMIGSLKSLGLISMRERAKQFNGTIDISAKENNGTKLIIFIPS